MNFNLYYNRKGGGEERKEYYIRFFFLEGEYNNRNILLKAPVIYVIYGYNAITTLVRVWGTTSGWDLDFRESSKYRELFEYYITSKIQTLPVLQTYQTDFSLIIQPNKQTNSTLLQPPIHIRLSTPPSTIPRTYPLPIQTHNTRLIRIKILRHGRPSKNLPPMNQIIKHTDAREPSENSRGVVHSRRRNGEGDGHTENNDRETYPQDGECVDGETEFPKGVGGVFDGAAAAEEGDEDWDSVGGGEADCCYAGEGVEGGGGAEVDAAEETVDGGGEDECVERDVEFLVYFSEGRGAGDGAVSGEGVGATTGGGESAHAGEE